MRRVLVIGLDGYDERLAERMMGAGGLPHLQQLHNRAARFDLDHGSDKYSGLSWEHVSTGRAPRQTGRWSAVDFDPERYTVRQAPTRHRPFAAELAAKMVVFDPPYFDLAQAPDVMGIVNWGAHDPGIRAQSNPPGLRDELRQKFGEYRGSEFVYGFTWPSAERTARAGQSLACAVAQRRDAARWLFAERFPEWDVAMVVVSEFHSVIEPMWHGVDVAHPLHCLPSGAPSRAAIEDVYAEADALVGELVDRFPDATIVAFAMHGMGPNTADVPSMLLLPELLYRVRFGTPLFDTPAEWRQTSLPMLGEHAGWEPTIKRLIGGPSEPGRTRAGRQIRHAIDRVRARVARMTGHGWLASGEATLDWMPASSYAPSWPHMDAFALPSFYDGRVRLNVQGREREGRIAPNRYRDHIDRVSDLLMECRDPVTGESIVDAISGPEDGDFMNLRASDADLKIVWRGAPLGLTHPRVGQIGPVPYRRTGGHTGEAGVALFAGEGIAPGDYGLRSSMDVVPTIVDLLGESTSNGLSGRSMRDAGFMGRRDP
jgi:predicted AlkP superfamily phosphohydrolase/phosphomutase